MTFRIMLPAVMAMALPPTAQMLPDSTMQALLVEVRQLRQALERSALLVPKMQVTMQRLQLQDQRLALLSAQLDTVRQEIARQATAPQGVAQQIAGIEQQLSTESDAVRRKDLERQRADLRAVMSAHVTDPQLLARESELASSLLDTGTPVRRQP